LVVRSPGTPCPGPHRNTAPAARVVRQCRDAPATANGRIARKKMADPVKGRPQEALRRGREIRGSALVSIQP
jgi:hypothetical protein